MRLKRLLVAGAMALGMAASTVLAGAAPAQAATPTVWVYVSYPTWLGNCESGGKVTGIQAYTDYSSTTWDVGDDIVWMKMAVHRANRIYATIFCSKWPGGYYRYIVRTDVVPTRNYQTLWVGPWGWVRN